MTELRDLKDLLTHGIQVLYSTEKLLLAGMPRMMEKAYNEELKAAFAQHLKETEQQVQRLEQAAKLLNIDPDGDSSTGIKGLIAEGEKVMHKDAAEPVLDAALIAGAQKIEHYEIAGYGTVVYMAEELGFAEVAQLLQQTLDEEKHTDSLLN
ncbi:MAG TPA: ferritin-like domain-containing protein, partial [Hymenobacter sp.]